MPEAQDIDRIRKAENDAKDRIRAAEDSAREIRRQVEVDVMEILKDAETDGRKAAEKRINKNETKRVSKEREFLKKIDRIIAQTQESSREREAAAVKVAVEMIIGGE